MGKEVFDRIRLLLNENKIVFEQIEHEHVRTSDEAARIRGMSLDEGAKAIVLKAKGRNNEYSFIQCVVPGDRKIDFKTVRKLLGLKSISLATPEEVLEITGCTIGSVPPFGPLFGINTYADEVLSGKDKIVFSAGTHNDSIRMAASDYLFVVRPVVLSFSIPR